MDGKQNQWKAWIFLLPTLVLLCVFTFWPIINTLIMAFQNGYTGSGAIRGQVFEFGIENFIKAWDVLVDPTKPLLLFTAIMALVTVPLSTILALLISVGLNSIPKFSKILQTIYFLPYVTNSIAIGMVFSAMFSIVGHTDPAQAESVGLINNLIMAFGGEPQNWVNAGAPQSNAVLVVCIYSIWNALPFKILILLGALQSVNKQYYEAAKIDGASKFKIFYKITVPMLSPMILYVVITGFIGAFKEYSSLVGVLGETYMKNTFGVNTVVGYIYEQLPNQRYGVAAAAALILLFFIMVITAINMWVSKKRVHY